MARGIEETHTHTFKREVSNSYMTKTHEIYPVGKHLGVRYYELHTHYCTDL